MGPVERIADRSDNPPPAAVGTQYCGPAVVSSVDLSGRTIKVARPADPDRLLDDPAVLDWNRRDDYMPYWAYLWPGAFLLADAVSRTDWSTQATGTVPLEALEIGCGLGLAGLAALAQGLRVVFTDYDQAPLEFVARSAIANGFHPSRFELRGSTGALPDEVFPVILAADVIYEAPLVPLVANLLRKLLAPGGLGLVASPFRVAALAFPDAIASVGLRCAAEPAEAVAEGGRHIEGTIYRVTR